jgi:hypothetical protein
VAGLPALRIVSWNVQWGSPGGWTARLEFLRSLGADVVCLQEVHGNVEEHLEPLAMWARTTAPHVPPEWARRNRLVVAVAGTAEVKPLGEEVLDMADFPEVPDWLAARFACRAIAADIGWRGTRLRVGSFHATPAASRGVGERKPWFHTRIGQWAATWDGPWVFALDANTPGDDHPDLGRVSWCWPAVGDGPGEDRLLGVLAPHAGTDALRRVYQRDGFPAGHRPGSAWQASKHLASGPVRYDHVLVSPSVEVLSCDYVWPPDELSDHAAVVVDVALADKADGPSLPGRSWQRGTPHTEHPAAPSPAPALKEVTPRVLAADDPAWQAHSGGAGHDRPGWQPTDVEAARHVIAGLNPVARRALEILAAEPGRQISNDELAERSLAASTRGLASSLRTLRAPDLDRRLPLRWWRHAGRTLYAVHPDDAAVFAAALEGRDPDTEP